MRGLIVVAIVLWVSARRASAVGWDGDDFLITGAPNFGQYIGVFDHDFTFKGYLDTNFLDMRQETTVTRVLMVFVLATQLGAQPRATTAPTNVADDGTRFPEPGPWHFDADAMSYGRWISRAPRELVEDANANHEELHVVSRANSATVVSAALANVQLWPPSPTPINHVLTGTS